MTWYRRLNWVNTLFITITPFIVLIGLPIDLYRNGFNWRLFVLFTICSMCSSISITAGYHRLFAHRSYESNRLLKLFYLIFGATAVQGSAIKWCSDHRRHHKHVDTDTDPYSIQKGFFFAHMGWVFLKEDPQYLSQQAVDLKNDPMVAWQARYCVWLALGFGLLMPGLIAMAFGSSLWSGMLWGGFTRVVFTQHCTFFINSLCHMWGTQPYSNKNSARDNFVLAFFTYGEGYHNYHHRFEADYRNGIRWYHWDPTKWLIRSLAFVGVTRNLKKMSDAEILKARLTMDETRLISRGLYHEGIEELKTKIEETLRKINHARARFAELQRDFDLQKEAALRQLRYETKMAKVELRALLEQWRLACRFDGNSFIANAQ